MARIKASCSIGDKEYLTVEELMGWLDVSEGTIRDWKNCGLRSHKIKGIIRYSKTEFHKFAKKFLE